MDETFVDREPRDPPDSDDGIGDGGKPRRSRSAELSAFVEWFRDAVISPTGHSPRVVRQRRLALGALLTGALGVIIAIVASQTGGGGTAAKRSAAPRVTTPKSAVGRHPRIPVPARPAPTLRTRVAGRLPAPVQDPAVTLLPAAAASGATGSRRPRPSPATPGSRTTPRSPTKPRPHTPPGATSPGQATRLAAVPRQGAFVVGGLDATDNSVSDIYTITVGGTRGTANLAAPSPTGTKPAGSQHTGTAPASGAQTGARGAGPGRTGAGGAGAGQAARVRSHHLLPSPLHDATAVTLGGSAYLFGGGQLETSRPDILRITPGGSVSTAGQLPQPASDVAAAVVGNTAYVVGGYTGSQALDTVVAWQPGQKAKVVGHLPTAVRYPAVAAINGHLIIVGGNSQAGTASRDVLTFDPTTGKATRIGRLRRGLTHAGVGVLGGMVYVFGGRGTATSSQHKSILSVDPRSGTSTVVGMLPRKLSDVGVVSLPDRILLIGGRDSSGTVRAEVLSVQHR